MRLIKFADAASIRAWAQSTGHTVGSRGAVSAELHNAFLAAQVRRAALATGKVVLIYGPQVAKAVLSRKTRP